MSNVKNSQFYSLYICRLTFLHNTQCLDEKIRFSKVRSGFFLCRQAILRRRLSLGISQSFVSFFSLFFPLEPLLMHLTKHAATNTHSLTVNLFHPIFFFFSFFFYLLLSEEKRCKANGYVCVRMCTHE